MGKGAAIASISTLVLTALATVGWVVFVGGFGAYNNEIRFFERVDFLSPEARELAFFNLNSHYIVAVLSPILLIVILVMSILAMTSKNKLGPYITAIMTIPIFILAAFIMISSGVVFYLYSLVITTIRLVPQTSFQDQEGTLNAIYTMFAGMLVEIIFLTGTLIAAFIGAILAAKDRGKVVDQPRPV